jgi:hypothetical protein
MAEVRVKKNHITGQKGKVQIPIYHTYGMDDVGACVDYLVEEAHWKEGKSGITAPEFEFSGSREKLIKLIEDEASEEDLRRLVFATWNDVQSALQLRRKRRYE